MCCPISIRGLQFVPHPALGGQRQSFLRYRGAGDIAAQAFQFLAFTCVCSHTSMQGETGDFANLLRATVVIFPGWDRLQGEDFAALLRTHCNAIGDGMSLKLVHRILVLPIHR